MRNGLWRRVRRKQLFGVQFYRQKPIGNYVVDFYAPAARLIVEIDGAYHLEPEQAARDRRRTAYFNQLGLSVLRFNDRQVLLELDSVVEAIYQAVAEKIPLNPPLPKGDNSRPNAHGFTLVTSLSYPSLKKRGLGRFFATQLSVIATIIIG